MERPGAYTLACIGDALHPYIKDPLLPLPPHLEPERELINYHQQKWAHGAYDTTWSRERIN